MKNILFLFITLGLFAQKSEGYYFVFLNSNPNKEVLDSTRVSVLQAQHLANIDRLYTEGKIVAAGPFYGGGGLFVFQEESIGKVNQLLQSDPAIAANRFMLEVFPMEFLLGTICPYQKPIEMLTYSFIRIPKAENEIVKKELEQLQKQFEYKVLSSVLFTNNKGGFLLLETDIETVQEQIKIRPVNLNLKQLYIAKGTFCLDRKK